MNNLKFRSWQGKKFEFSDDCFGEGIEAWKLSEFFEWATHDPINQWSGLKDRNGKDVYSDDIVQEQLIDGVGFCGRVYFAAGTFLIDGDGPLFDHTYSLTPDILEDFLVVGNIHETPELLNL